MWEVLITSPLISQNVRKMRTCVIYWVMVEDFGAKSGGCRSSWYSCRKFIALQLKREGIELEKKLQKSTKTVTKILPLELTKPFYCEVSWHELVYRGMNYSAVWWASMLEMHEWCQWNDFDWVLICHFWQCRRWRSVQFDSISWSVNMNEQA